MPKYEVSLIKPVWTAMTVEADDEEDAIEKALNSDAMPHRFCAQCTGWNQPWSIDDDDEWDLPPTTIEEARAYVNTTPVKLIEDENSDNSDD